MDEKGAHDGANDPPGDSRGDDRRGGRRAGHGVRRREAMDRVEIVSDSETLKTPAGEFRECLRTEEMTPLEPDAKDTKVYARGVGMISDGGLLLTEHTAAHTRGP